MRININQYNTIPMRGNSTKKQSPASSEKDLKRILEPFTTKKDAMVPALNLMKGINPNNNNVFDSFTKIDDVTRGINFVKSQEDWDACLLEEFEEFKVARKEYEADRTKQNFDHMEEEMGDIFYTAASIAKDSGIDPKEAFKATNRKFFNRINLMERLCTSPKSGTPDSLKDCKDYERRALWNAAKRKLYDAQTLQYNA